MKIVFNAKRFLYMLLVFPWIEPAIFQQIKVIDFSFNLMKLVSFAIIVILYTKRHQKLDLCMLTIISCYTVSVISTVYHGGAVIKSVIQLTSITALQLLVKLLLEEEPILCFDVFLQPLEILLYANLISILLYPKGMYVDFSYTGYMISTNWILGIDNAQAPYYISGIAITIIRDYYRFSSLKISSRSWCLITVCLITILLRWQATVVVGMVIIIPVIICPKIFMKSKTLNALTYMIGVLIVFFAIIIFRSQNYFSFIIQKILKKSLTFSGRTLVWDRAISVILKNPLLGIGIWNTEKNWSYLGQIHTHNIFLQMLVLGGILQLLIFLILHVLVVKELMKNKHNPIACFLSALIFSMLIMNQAEIHQTGLWYIVYLLAFNSNKIIFQESMYCRKKIDSKGKYLNHINDAVLSE